MTSKTGWMVARSFAGTGCSSPIPPVEPGLSNSGARLWTGTATSGEVFRNLRRVTPSPATAAREHQASSSSGSRGRVYVRRLPHPYGAGRRLLQRRHCRPPARPQEDLIRPRLRPTGPWLHLPPGWRGPLGRGAVRPGSGRHVRHHLPDPLFPIYKRGHYGGFIGRSFDTMGKRTKALVQEVRTEGAGILSKS